MMKKIIFLLSVCMILSVVFGACDSNKQPDNNSSAISGSQNSSNSIYEFDFDAIDTADAKYQALIFGHSDSSYLSSGKIEYEFPDHEKYDNISISKTIDISINDKSISCSYKDVSYKSYDYYPSYRYFDANKNEYCVDDNGKLVFYYSAASSKIEKQLTQNECIEAAKKYANQFTDISQYEMTVEDQKERQRYIINFRKYINGIKTTDSLRIVIQYDGTVFSYSAFMLGRVNADNTLKEIDAKGATASALQKLDELYKGTESKYSRVEYNDPDVMLTVLKDGSTALIYIVDVDCVKTVDIYDVTTSEQISLVVVLE